MVSSSSMSAPLMVTVSGVRGIANVSLTPELVKVFVASFIKYLESKHPTADKLIVLGRDSRISGLDFEKLTIATITSLGWDVQVLGICPTPTVQFMVPKLNATGGLVITSSHNPAEWNGLKFVDMDGLFVTAENCETIFSIYRSQTAESSFPILIKDPEKHGTASNYDQAMQEHIDAVTSLEYVHVDQIKAAHFKVAIDTINGAGSLYIPALLEALGVEVVGELNTDPTGMFSHIPEPVPQNLTDLCQLVKSIESDFGIAVDPDADRLVIINEKGEPIGEEYTLALCVDFFLSEKTRRGPVVKNLSTSRVIDDICRKYHCACYSSAVGEANVAAMMERVNAVIGGEGNGGIMLPDVHVGRDSLVGLALILEHFSRFRQSRSTDPAPPALSDLVGSLPHYDIIKDKISLSEQTTPEQIKIVLQRVEEEWKKKIEEERAKADNEELKALWNVNDVDGIRIDTPDWWVHLRMSNTEPIVRIIAEAPTRVKAREQCTFFARYFSIPSD
ncbi:phosphomannomutase [Blattamonas nauphoetae]|uniref:Phosphomannomutase n=1 Tax=Blattamonas nauphoetae TaxID=2049346 RepID=A0ABQ9YL19_9EUKA|nr:phosphomannomutase [Blattamonas nauphoetae]